MLKRILRCLALLVVFSFGIQSISSAAVYRAVASGDWGDASIWDVAPFDGFGGDGVPGTGDIAITNSFQIGLNPLYGDITVDRITVTNNVANSLYYNDPFFLFAPVRLTINLSLSSTGFPTTQVIENTGSIDLVINGTGSSVINNWSIVSPFNNITFSSGGTTTIASNIAIDNSLTVSSGTTLQVGSGVSISDFSGSAVATISSGANLVVNGAINGDGSTGSRFSTVTINGSATTGTAGYLNAETVTLGSGSALTINFNGTNQTDGWWYQSNAPTVVSVSPTSTVTYGVSATQGIGATNYGNLVISGGVAKDMSSTGVLNVDGNLTIGASTTFNTSTNSNPIDVAGNIDNNGAWEPDQMVIFDGTSAQVIQGNNAVVFNGGLRVENTAGLSLLNVGTDINGIMDVDAGTSFDPSDQTVLASANLQVDGTLLAGTDPAGFVFDGTTSFLGSGTRNFNDFTITGSVTAPLGSLNIAGDFTNNGTFNANNGTVAFNGNAAQSIGGTSTTSFENINIDNTGATVSATSATDLIGIITLASNSSFDAGGNLTLVSNVSGTATVAAIPTSADFIGDVIYQRYFGGSGDYWRNWGTPVAGSVSDITGAGFTINGNDLAIYNETALGNVDQGWILQSAFGTSISNTRGYTQWTRSEELPRTISFTGTMNTHDVNFGITYTDDPDQFDSEDGWNFINNPYASTIDWASTSWTRNSSVNSMAAVWDGNAYQYLDALASNQLISSGQGFWVQTNAAGPVLTASENVKSNTSTAFLRTNDGRENWIQIAVSDGEVKDIAHVRFREDATEEFDTRYDGIKLNNQIFNFSSLTEGGLDLAVNSMPFEACNRIVNLSLTNINEGTYEMQFNDLNTLNVGYEVSLVDNFAGNTINRIAEGQSYSFNVTNDAGSYGIDRFQLVFTAESIDETIDYNQAYEYTCEEYVKIKLNNTQPGISYQVLSDNGGQISNALQGTGDQLELFVQKSVLNRGMNTIGLLIQGKEGCVADHTVQDFITFELIDEPGEPTTETTTFCGAQQVALQAIGAPGGSVYRWYENSNGDEILFEDTSGQFITPELSTSRTYYVSYVTAHGCESQRVSITAEQVSLAMPDVENITFCTEGTVTLKASGAPVGSVYRWFETSSSSEVLFEEASGEYVTPDLTASRTYYVSYLTADGCESGRMAITAQKTSLDMPAVTDQLSTCVGSSIVLSASGASEGQFYKWYASSEAVEPMAETTNGQYELQDLTQSQNFYVSLATTQGCESSKVMIAVEVVSVDKPTFTINGQELVSSTVADSYQWYRDGQPIEGATNQTYVANTGGNYSVNVTINGCSGISDEQTFLIAATDEDLYDAGLSIYPNPVESILNISAFKNTGNVNDMHFAIFNLNGKQVRGQEDIRNNNGNLYFNVGDLRSGIYVLNIYNKNRIIAIRLQKH